MSNVNVFITNGSHQVPCYLPSFRSTVWCVWPDAVPPPHIATPPLSDRLMRSTRHGFVLALIDTLNSTSVHSPTRNPSGTHDPIASEGTDQQQMRCGVPPLNPSGTHDLLTYMATDQQLGWDASPSFLRPLVEHMASSLQCPPDNTLSFTSPSILTPPPSPVRNPCPLRFRCHHLTLNPHSPPPHLPRHTNPHDELINFSPPKAW